MEVAIVDPFLVASAVFVGEQAHVVVDIRSQILSITYWF